jgi:hypothetical protein
MKFVLLLVPTVLLAQSKADAPPPPKGTISGTVLVAGTDKAMAGVEVSANRGTPQAGSAITDALGHYVIKDVTPGQVRLAATTIDAVGRRSGFGPNSQRLINLAPGQDLANIDFHVLVYGRIAGHVMDQNKEPVVGATVYLVTREYSYGKLRAFFTGSVNTDDEGNYVLTVLPARAYAVLVQKRNRIAGPHSDAPLDPALRLPAFVPTYYPNAAAIDGAEMITLKPGELREGLDIRVLRSPSFCLDAVLEGASGQVPFAIGETQPTSGLSGNGGYYTSMPGGQSGKDGRIRVCDLHPGEYELSVHTFGAGAFAGTTGFASTIVTIGDHDVAGVRLALRPKLPVTGEVVWDGPAPQTPATPPKLTLSVQAITRTERGNTQSEIPGTFSFEGGLAMDEFGLDISRLPPGAYVKDVEYGGHSILYAPLPVGKALGEGGLRITLGQDGGTVSARVTNKDGNPVADCTVVIMPAAASSEAILAASMRFGKSDQNGSWQSTVIPPGKYYAIATNDTIDRSPEAIGKLWKARTSATELELTAHGKTSVSLEAR